MPECKEELGDLQAQCGRREQACVRMTQRLLDGVTTEAGPESACWEEWGWGRCWHGVGETQGAYPGPPLGSQTPQGFTMPEPVLHRNWGSPGDPRTPSGQNFHPCLHCKFSEGRAQLITAATENLQWTLGACQARG